MSYYDSIAIDPQAKNRNAVFKLVFHSGKISKPEIAHHLGISLPTAIQHVKTLTEEGLLVESGMLDSTGGRKAMAISVEENALYSVGVDISTYHITAVLVNLRGAIVERMRIRQDFADTPEYYGILGDVVSLLLQNRQDADGKILGAGISLPGFLSEDGQLLVYSHSLGVSNIKCSGIARNIPYKSILCQNANAAGLAEMWANPYIKDAVYLSLDDNVGGAIFIDGQLYRGQNMRSGEFGHMTLINDGQPCYCGKLGCINAYCSAPALVAGFDEPLETFFESLNAGSPEHVQRWNEYVYYLVMAVDDLRMAFDCDVILGGSVGDYADAHLDEIREAAALRNSFGDNGEYLLAGQYKNAASAVGAALMQVRNFINQL